MKIIKEKMVKYSDYKYDETKPFPQELIDSIPWLKFKIIVPTVEDKIKIQKVIEYLHYCDIDTDYVWVNQIVHTYEQDEETQSIIVDKNIFESL